MWPWRLTHLQQNSSVVPTVSLYSSRCFGGSFEMRVTANQTYGAHIWKHGVKLHLLFTLFSCPDSSHIKFHMKQAEDTDRTALWSVPLFSTSLLSSRSISPLPVSLSLSFPVCLAYYSDEFPWVSAFKILPHTYIQTHATHTHLWHLIAGRDIH